MAHALDCLGLIQPPEKTGPWKWWAAHALCISLTTSSQKKKKERKLKQDSQEDWIPASTHIRAQVKEGAAPKEGQLWGSCARSTKTTFPPGSIKKIY